jgi:LMBR1 domain-containing protein 1
VDLAFVMEAAEASSIPHSVLAAGWIPFIVVLLLAVAFSVVYVLWYRSHISEEKSCSATCISIAALSITLLASSIVPVDVFLVSYMKFDNGTYKPWAVDPEVRNALADAVLDT